MGFIDDKFAGFHTNRYLCSIEITELSSHPSVKNGVRVRIVCLWRPIVTYLEELPKILNKLFTPITEKARIPKINGKQTINLSNIKGGRKPDPDYDEAYKRIQDGEDYRQVFSWYCKKSNIKETDPYNRRRFKEAMKRRDK
ncbi:MAG: hypothetical protein ABIL07_07375 [candidate division WOR-3 bacterium]